MHAKCFPQKKKNRLEIVWIASIYNTTEVSSILCSYLEQPKQNNTTKNKEPKQSHKLPHDFTVFQENHDFSMIEKN